MEELNKIYKEFVKLMTEVTKRFKNYSDNEKILIEYEEGRVSAFFNVCYMMEDIPEKLMDTLKGEFELYKNLAGMEE